MTPYGAIPPIDPHTGAMAIGVPVCNTHVKVITDAGHEAGPREIGEFVISGPQIVPGYWQKPEETSKALTPSGLKTGDVVTSFGDRVIESPKDLSRAVAETASGATVPLKVWRDGSEKTVEVKIAEMKEEVASADHSEQGGEPSASDTVDQLGATLAPVNDMTRQQFGLSEDAKGVVIADLEQDSALAEQGVRPGDVIERVNDRKIANPGDVTNARRLSPSAIKVRDNASEPELVTSTSLCVSRLSTSRTTARASSRSSAYVDWPSSRLAMTRA